MAAPGGRKKVFRLMDVVQPFSDLQIQMLTSKSVQRILLSEKAIAQSGMSHVSLQYNTSLFILVKGSEELTSYLS